ncbi:MAG: hypothetical protein QM820_01500 [Minicystis sp.]
MRPALCAGLSFMDAARSESLGLGDLVTWMRGHLVEPGLMPMPGSVHEPGVGAVPISEAPNHAWATSHEQRAARIVATARVRVAVMLGGLVARPLDDRFLAAAIFAGRVTRMNTEDGRAWLPSPKEGDRLSDIVLACFAADALDHRDEYDDRLSVCEVCGRIGFARDTVLRTRCAQHES